MFAEDESKELNLDHLPSIHGSRALQPTQTTVAPNPLPPSIPMLPIAMAMISSAQVQPHVFHQEDTPWNVDPAEHQAPGVVQPQPHRHASHQQQQIGKTQTQQTQQTQHRQHDTAPSLQHSNLQGGGDELPHQPHPEHTQQPLEHLDLIGADTQFDQIHSRPRRLLNSVSRSLPLLLTVVVAYIYYVYTVRVCITYLIMDQKQPLHGGLYLAVFNVLILLFAVSYYQSIFTSPGSPSNPPSLRNPPPSIPPTTTPYQSHSPGPTRSGSDDRVSSHASATSPTAPSFQPSRLAHPSSSIAPIGPRYLPSVSSDSPEHKDDHVIAIPPDNTSIHGHHLSIDFSAAPGAPPGSILGHGSARSRVHIVDDSLQRPVATIGVCKRDGRSRWCDICKIVKPDRCHHCSECNICVLRMDHHCPWVNGCVGFGNYKQFYLFILYGSLSAVWVVGTMIPLLVKTLGSHAQDDDGWRKGNWTDGNYAYRNHTWDSRRWSNGTWTDDGSMPEAIRAFDIQWVVITVVTFLLALLIVSFTVVHTRYILSNQTTIESLQDVRNMHVKVQYRKREPTPQPHNISVNVNGAGGGDGVAGLPPFVSEFNHNIVMVEQGERLWDQGSWLANWKSIMGPTWWLWFVPYWNSQGDGIHDIYNATVYKRLLADALAQARMQAVNFGVVRDLAGEELAAPASPGLGPALGPMSSPPISPTSPTRPRNGTIGSQSKAPAVPSSSRSTLLVGTGGGSPRKRTATAPPMLMPSIRMQYDGSEASGSRDPGFQLRQGVASSIDSQAGQADVSVDDGSMVAQGHRSSSAVSTPRQNNTPRSQSPRQPRTPKSRSHETGINSNNINNNNNNNNNTSRRRQRTMSGGTGMSYGFGGPIKEFGLGLGMEGIPADSGTGLKLSSALLARSSHGHLRSQERGGGGGSSHGSRQPRATQ